MGTVTTSIRKIKVGNIGAWLTDQLRQPPYKVGSKKISFSLLLDYFRADLLSRPKGRSGLRSKDLEGKMPERGKSKQR